MKNVPPNIRSTFTVNIFTYTFLIILANLTNQMRVNFTLKDTYPENASEL